MTSVAMLSLHTSPLAQPGSGDSGGMNVYVRELSASLAQAGVPTRVYVRRTEVGTPDVVEVEPFFEVCQIEAGPLHLPKELLPDVVDRFADGVASDIGLRGAPSVLHANYWLSAQAGHRLKHELGIPLVTTFHTLARVKSELGMAESALRAETEELVIGCSDAICAANAVEASDLVRHYGADLDRIEIVSPGVDHAFFSPGDMAGARRALALGDEPVLLFVGRIQPLKGLDLAVRALAETAHAGAILMVVGGPSGAGGLAEFERIRRLIDQLGVADRVRFVEPQPHHALSTYYRAANVVLVPSRSESFGLVAAESAACGTPVIASAVGGLRSLVRHGQTGLLLESRSPGVWADAIDSLLGDRESALMMGKAAAEEGRGYSWPIMGARLRRVYADAAAKGSRDRCGVS